VRGLGADVLINYREVDFAQRITETEQGRGVDVIVDSIGGEVFEKSIRLLSPLGRIVSVGLNSRTPNEVKTSSLLFHTWGVLGFHMSALWAPGPRPHLFRSCFDELVALYREGKIRPVIGHRYGLADASEAHRLMESRGSFGKILLLPDGEGAS
jgi:NADPH2:quinone reductase